MKTSNHEYNIPKKGTQDWHIPINSNFKSIEKHIEVRDQDQRRDYYTPYKGAKFVATDTGAVYDGNGDSWDLSSRVLKSLHTDNFSSKPIHVLFSSDPSIKDDSSINSAGYDDLNEAVDDAPDQSVISVRGNVTVDETIRPSGTYFGILGSGGYNRSDNSGMPSITAIDGFVGDWLIDLSDVGSKWGFIQDINLFCEGNVAGGIKTGGSDNGRMSNISLYRWDGGIGIENGEGAFDNVYEHCLLNAKGVGETGFSLFGGNEPKILNCLIREYLGSGRGILIDDIGNVGPRIRDTSCRGLGSDPGYGVEIRNSGQTNNIHIDSCQFENNKVGVVYAPEQNQGAVADVWVYGSTFVSTNNLAIETDNKMGEWIIGPFNYFESDVVLKGSAFSSGTSTVLLNRWFSELDISGRNVPTTILEPALNRVDLHAPVRTSDSVVISQSYDLSQKNGEEGEVARHDGSNNSAKGLYEFTGSNWIGIGTSSGDSITPQ